jgi:hypothetical protein
MPLVFVTLLACGNNGSERDDDSESPICSDAFYADADGDGYGDVSHTTTACSIPSGYAVTADDCDDTNPAVHPGAAEVCDGLDNDCDDSVDVGAIDPLTWYADNDADGFGDDVAIDQQCAQPSGSVDVGGDCDDTNAAVHPGAAEVCDGIDNDCDESVDTGANDATWYADNDEDGFGDDVAMDPQCAETSGSVEVGGDCDDNDPAVNPTANEICDDGLDNDCDGWACATVDLSSADAKLVGEEEGDRAGCSVSGAGDVNGDGHDDLIVGAYDDDEGARHAGAAYLVLGPLTGTLDLSAADAKLVGEARDDEAGSSVSSAGDVDGDGHDDLLVGADHNAEGGSWAGAAYVVLGPVTGTLDLSLADAKLVGESGDFAGGSVSGAGDVDGDGHDDVLVGAYANDEGGDYGGAAYLVLGPFTGTLDWSLADAKLVSESGYDYAGVSVSGAGDVDGDGHDDVLVGAMRHGEGTVNNGVAYLVLGPVSGSRSLSTADAKLAGEESGDYAGSSVSGAGDVDGDGHADLLVGANNNGSTDAGAAYLVLGPVSGADVLSVADAKLVGEAALDHAGFSVSAAGDMDGEGHDDLLIGAPYNSEGGGSAGSAHIVLGPVTGTLDLSLADAKLVGEAASDWAGQSVSGAGDVDGDGRGDVLVGAYGNAEGGPAAGAAYLVYGGGL